MAGLIVRLLVLMRILHSSYDQQRVYFRDWVNCKVTHPDVNIAFVLRPTEDVLPWLAGLIVRLHILMRLLQSSYDQRRTYFRGWVNCKVTHPDVNIAFVLRPTEDVLPWMEIVSDNSNADIESFSPSPIPNLDSNPLMEEIDLFFNPDDPMPPGIVDKDYDSERDILTLKDLPSNNTLSFSEKESFHFDIPPFSRPPAKPPDGDTGILNIKMMGDISDQKTFMHTLMITLASH
nr:hypothetical protein [Tanacetum cinerariifolium]